MSFFILFPLLFRIQISNVAGEQTKLKKNQITVTSSLSQLVSNIEMLRNLNSTHRSISDPQIISFYDPIRTDYNKSQLL